MTNRHRGFECTHGTSTMSRKTVSTRSRHSTQPFNAKGNCDHSGRMLGWTPPGETFLMNARRFLHHRQPERCGRFQLPRHFYKRSSSGQAQHVSYARSRWMLSNAPALVRRTPEKGQSTLALGERVFFSRTYEPLATRKRGTTSQLNDWGSALLCL